MIYIALAAVSIVAILAVIYALREAIRINRILLDLAITPQVDTPQYVEQQPITYTPVVVPNQANTVPKQRKQPTYQPPEVDTVEARAAFEGLVGGI